MPRGPQGKAKQLGSRTLIIDNGAYTIKAGFVGDGPSDMPAYSLVPNCIAKGADGPRSTRVYVGDELDACKDFAEMSFRRPVERGYVVNWDAQLDVWKQSFFNKKAKLHCDPQDTNAVITEAPNAPHVLQQNVDQILFEEIQFASAYRCIGPSICAFANTEHSDQHIQDHPQPPECMIVVDTGYSATTVVPVLRGRPIHAGIRRLEVGGRLLTNRLKELISLRQFNLMDDTYLVNQIKEDVCFVSQDFNFDLERSWQATGLPAKRIPNRGADIVLDYVLPDYQSILRGFARPYTPQVAASGATGQKPKEDSFPLSNERFAVPEILFTPSDVGLRQAGIPETIVQSLESLPPGLWPAALANVLVVGGNACLPGFTERLLRELRCLSPSECEVRVSKHSDPIGASCLGGLALASDRSMLQDRIVTREEYHEYGASWALRQFANGPRK